MCIVYVHLYFYVKEGYSKRYIIRTSNMCVCICFENEQESYALVHILLQNCFWLVMCVFSETLLSPSYEVKKANEIKEKQQLMIRVLYWHGQLQIAVCAKAQKIKKTFL